MESARLRDRICRRPVQYVQGTTRARDDASGAARRAERHYASLRTLCDEASRFQQAEPTAAAAQAARQVLIAQYPSAQAEIDTLLAQQLASDASAHTEGIWELSWGALRRRQSSSYETRTVGRLPAPTNSSWRPGAYQTTPDWQGFVLHPGLAHAKPFMLRSAAQFRPRAPPPLGSRSYARAFEEVKEFGALASTVRTADQTAYAVWWMEFSEGLVNRFARRSGE